MRRRSNGMNAREAGKKARQLYGSKAFVKVNKNGLRDILLHVPMEKIIGELLGWGHTWEDAFQLAKKRAKRYEKKNPKPR